MTSSWQTRRRRTGRAVGADHVARRALTPGFIASWAVLAVALISVPGCGGCRPDATEGGAEEEEARQADFESAELQVLPTDADLAAYGIKPGHWLGLRQELKSNKADFYGELGCFSGDRDRVPVRLSNSPYEVTSRRPVALPKGQGKSFELTCLVPHAAGRQKQIWLYSDLQTGYGGAARFSGAQVANRLRAFQNFFVVLARRPEAYNFLKTLESIRPPNDELSLGEFPSDYATVFPSPAGPALLPSWPLLWTGISYVLWDDYDPALLSPDQQRSLLDWLHWGGQLIVSGPNTLDLLRGSFLGDYLPADAESTRSLTADEVSVINQFWSIDSRNSRIQPEFPWNESVPIPVLTLALREEAQFVPGAAELVAERRVGRGRVAATAFNLASRDFANWRRFDNFFNAVLLRRPPRTFNYELESGLTTHWITEVESQLRRLPQQADEDFGGVLDEQLPNLYTAEALGSGRGINEAFLTSRLRYFSRDAAFAGRTTSGFNTSRLVLDADGYRCDANAGVAGWNDFSDCGELARRALLVSAGIVVPERSLILWSLGLYLFVLVPANWTIFRALGRVEWAWAAVPLIALIGTLAVVRLAQLDIGFARSRTEIAVVETQSDYRRAHVTRYLGLYTSLSTQYELSFDDASALAVPFPTGATLERQRQSGRTASLLRPDKRAARVMLTGLSVSSNTTGMVHSEQMRELTGPIRCLEKARGLYELSNETEFDLRDVGVLRRRNRKLEFARVGLLKSGAVLRIQFRQITDDDVNTLWPDFGELPGRAGEALDLKPFLELAVQPERLNEGDSRLVAWTESEFPGLAVQPAASQRLFRTVWVCNLAFNSLPPPLSDTNAPTDFRPEATDDRTD